jgi:hypothetical protein
MSLGPRPADPTTISFDPRCFVQDGTVVYWTVGSGLGGRYPERFDDESAAIEHGRLLRLRVTRHEHARMVRVSWT